MPRILRSLSVSQAGLDVFLANVWVVVEDLLVSPPGRQEFDDELNCQTGPFDHWLTDQDFGVDGDALLPLHTLKISVR